MITITPISAFSDNYIWMIQSGNDSHVFVVDPGDASPVIQVLEEKGLELAGILITHHHADHVGGISDLLSHYAGTDVPVYGPENPSIRSITHRLAEGATIQVLGVDFRVMEVPGHTLDHIAYFSHQPEQPLLFCGDTLFASGCGRLFEGTAQQMHDSLAKLSALPPETRVYCAHEYTLANLKFAQAVEPESAKLIAHIEKCQQLRKDNRPTVPTTLATELEVNPFLRSHINSVKTAAERHAAEPLNSATDVFRATRTWKDRF